MTTTPLNPHLQRRHALQGFAAGALITALGLLGSPLAAETRPPLILVFGDSLSAEYGLKRGSGWVTLLQDRLRKEGFPHRIMNASISGETTAGGLARLPAVLERQKPQLLILQLGANDGLRGLPIAQTRKNLEAMIAAAQKVGAQTLILGIRIPPNYGLDYTRQFDGLFTALGRDKNLPVVPFLLDGVAENPAMFQADALHPNESAQPRMFANVWSVLSSSGLLARSASAATPISAR